MERGEEDTSGFDTHTKLVNRIHIIAFGIFLGFFDITGNRELWLVYSIPYSIQYQQTFSLTTFFLSCLTDIIGDIMT